MVNFIDRDQLAHDGVIAHELERSLCALDVAEVEESLALVEMGRVYVLDCPLLNQ